MGNGQEKKFSAADFTHCAKQVVLEGTHYTEPDRPGLRWVARGETRLFIDSKGFRDKGGWERPHSHTIHEVILLRSGRAAVASLKDGRWRISEMTLNKPVNFWPGDVHALYLAGGPFHIQVLKVGQNVKTDWIAAPAKAATRLKRIHPLFSHR
mgnify:CR=1 FL=1